MIQVADGKQVMRFDAHSDWVWDHVFAQDDHLITVSRDMSMKLVVVENGQFVDNITEHHARRSKVVCRRCSGTQRREEVLCGGSDGEPKLYQNLPHEDTRHRRRLQPHPWLRPASRAHLRLQFNKDGSKFVVGSSTATGGAARIYSTDDGKLLHEMQGIKGPIFSVAFRPDGQQVAVGGSEKETAAALRR